MTTTTAPAARTGEAGRGGATTLATRVRDWADAYPDRVAMRHKHLGIWQEVSWADYWQAAREVGHALIELGIEPGDRVAVHSENRIEWLFTDVATLAARAAPVGR
jgi:long-chain acyl-CoA synthetase